MKTNILATAAGLSDQDLLARLVALAGREGEASVELVAHLAALDTRPAVYAAKGYGSSAIAPRLFGSPNGGFPRMRRRQPRRQWRPRRRPVHPPNRSPRSLLRPLPSWPLPVRSSRPPLRSATGSSSPSATRPTRSFDASRPFSAVRSRTATPARSSTEPSPCCSRRSNRRSSGRRPDREHAGLSVPGRITASRDAPCPRARSRGRSSARYGSVIQASVPSSRPTGAGARRA
jgi:hypothetical protein